MDEDFNHPPPSKNRAKFPEFSKNSLIFLIFFPHFSVFHGANAIASESEAIARNVKKDSKGQCGRHLLLCIYAMRPYGAVGMVFV